MLAIARKIILRACVAGAVRRGGVAEMARFVKY